MILGKFKALKNESDNFLPVVLYSSPGCELKEQIAEVWAWNQLNCGSEPFELGSLLDDDDDDPEEWGLLWRDHSCS